MTRNVTYVTLPNFFVLGQTAHYGDAPEKKLDPLSRIFKVTQGHRNRHVSIGYYDFLLTLHSDHKPISYHFRDKRQFQSEFTIFPTPRVFNDPTEAVPLVLDSSI